MDYIDIHGHYAWDIDDGIPTIEDCKKALELAKLQQISSIVATPHFTSGYMNEELKILIQERIKELKVLGKDYSIDVIEGCELMLNSKSDDAIERDLFLPIENTKYVLCEYDVRKPTELFLDHFEHYVRTLIIKGYTPIIAHVERYFHDEIDLDYVQYLIDLGCVIQVNSTNILHLGSDVHYQNALTLLDHNMVHCIASDTHRCQGIRIPNLDTCFKELIKKGFSKEYAYLLLNFNPRHIIHNEDIEVSEYKRSFISKLFKK